MRCVSYMRRDSYWIDERCGYHKPTRRKEGEYDYYDLDGDLIAQQREHIREYADKLGWVVEEEYIDLEGRDGYDRLKRDGYSRKFDCLITDSFYRFADSIGEAIVTMQHVFIPVGVHVAVAQDRFCSELSTKKSIEGYFSGRMTHYVRESTWIERERARKEGGGTVGIGTSRKEPQGKRPAPRRSRTILGSRICDGETGEALLFTGGLGTGILYRSSDAELIKWEIPCPYVPYNNLIGVVREALQQEKAAAEWAKANLFSEAAEKKKEELIAPLRTRAKLLLEETSNLLAEKAKRMNKDHGEENPAGESCGNGEHEVRERPEDERLVQIDKEFIVIMKEVQRIQHAYSLSNYWIKRFDGIDIPMNLTNENIRSFIDDIRIFGMGDQSSEEYKVQVIVRYDEVRSLLPEEWLPCLTFSIPNPAKWHRQENV